METQKSSLISKEQVDKVFQKQEKTAEDWPKMRAIFVETESSYRPREKKSLI